MATLSVYFEQRRVGTIDIDKNGPSFTYDPGWMGLRGAFPISITMPLRSERIASDTFLPWAANLLPESVQLRTLGQLLGMARGDVIGFLSAIGGDTAPSQEVVRAFSVARFLEEGLLPTAGKCRKQIAPISTASLSRLEMHLSIPSSWDHT